MSDAPTATEGQALPSEFDSIAPEFSAGGTVRIAKNEIHPQSSREGGVEVRVRPFRTRELLHVGRILTGQTRPLDLNNMLRPIIEAPANTDAQYAAFVAAFMQLATTIPHSERDFLTLITQIIDPVTELNSHELSLFFGYMENPEPEDTVAILYQAFTNERTRLGSLGKLLLSMTPKLGSGVEEISQPAENPGP
jgi:hypothetical protein